MSRRPNLYWYLCTVCGHKVQSRGMATLWCGCTAGGTRMSDVRDIALIDSIAGGFARALRGTKP